MEKALIKHGNSLAIVIDKPVSRFAADHSRHKDRTDHKRRFDQCSRHVRDKKRQARLQAALQKINNQFGDDLKKLAE